MDAHPNATVASEPTKVYSAQTKGGIASAVEDLWEGLKRGSIWRAFAWDEIQHRYRRSTLGLAWIVISYVIFVLAITLFFSGFSSMQSGGFVAYVAVGYAVFGFLIGNVTDGCVVFSGASTWIKSSSLPYSIYIYKSIARSFFPFIIQIATALVIMAFFGWRPHWSGLLAVPALAVFLLNAIWIQLFFGLIAARWRDVAHLVGALTRVLFFTTPILWVFEERTGIVRQVASINPLTHFLRIFRAPVLGDVVPLESWYHVASWTVGGWVVAIFLASIMRRRLPLWV
ncbi:ABC transporter permease [Maricaulis parjimensis]|uniref:ABC transporter permease n=1 Tax=Maricaulis parjimensis TaxID=144023 RepID=UPI00193A1BA1|nr:ABC transporter permease [Maricaulis parjimensis]